MSGKRSNQKGFTFIELIVAMIIAAMITGAVVASIIQLFTMSDTNSNYNAAFTQVQSAGYWVSHDAVQAEQVTLTPDFITLNWVDWDGTNAYKVVYTLEGSGQLKRSYYKKIDGSEEFELQGNFLIAQYIDPSTTCEWNEEEGVLTLVVTAQVGDQTVSRTYKVEARPTT